MIAPYIYEAEYSCPHCGALPPDLYTHNDVFQSLFSKFTILREAWGKQIIITSGYRCSAHEQEVSGFNFGPHTYGLALDLGIESDRQKDFMDMLESKCHELRVGTSVKPGQTHIHIDVCYLIVPRPTLAYQRRARWVE
jgi:hypothetical protein